MKGKLLMAGGVALVLVAGLFAASRWPRQSTGNESTTAPASQMSNNDDDMRSAVGSEAKRDILIAERDARLAPEIASGEWINSEPLKLENLRGRVVLVDFWTFGCYNCRNTLPTLKRFDETYRARGLTVIGIHSPEFDREKIIGQVRREISSLGIKYPVVTDNDYDTWRAYNVEAWPTVIILDKRGRIRFTHIGEGLYQEQENIIKELLAE
jgi:thiol-disulfide isomerase/thioredoxin